MPKTHLFLVLFILSFCTQGQVFISSENNPRPLANNEQVKFRYTDKSVSFDSIRKLDFSETYTSGNIPTHKEVIWLSFDLKNENDRDLTFYLYSFSPFFELYRKEKDLGWSQSKSGYLASLSKITPKKERRFLPIFMKAGEESSIFIRLQNGKITRSTGNPTIGDELFYLKKKQSIESYFKISQYFSLIYFSAVSVIFFFILLLYAFLRNKVHLYYLLYLFFQIIYSQLVFLDSPLNFLNPAAYHPEIVDFVLEASQFIFIGFYVYFILNLMDIPYISQLGKAMRILAWTCFAYAGFSIIYFWLFPIPESKNLLIATSRIILLPINLILIVWIIWKIKHPLMGYFISAHLFFFSGSVISVVGYLLAMNGIHPALFDFGNSFNTIFQIGLLGEVICFAFALALNMRGIQQAKERNALAFITQLKENKHIQERMNKKLDQKVEEKTAELIEVYSAMEKQREREMKLEFSQKIKELETIALRSQMNPHFLFNSLSAIKLLVMTQQVDKATHYLDNFSRLLRNVLENSRKKTVSVTDELNMIELYLAMEKERLGDTYKFIIESDSQFALSKYQIPSMLLQPLAENAIWHGLGPSSKKIKKLIIRFKIDGNLKISVEDNGIGRSKRTAIKVNNSVAHQPLGLQLTRERIALFNQGNSPQIKLEIIDLKENDQPAGTRVQLTYFE